VTADSPTISIRNSPKPATGVGSPAASPATAREASERPRTGSSRRRRPATLSCSTATAGTALVVLAPEICEHFLSFFQYAETSRCATRKQSARQSRQARARSTLLASDQFGFSPEKQAGGPHGRPRRSDSSLRLGAPLQRPSFVSERGACCHLRRRSEAGAVRCRFSDKFASRR
jgi:hypothetical protein